MPDHSNACEVDNSVGGVIDLVKTCNGGCEPASIVDAGFSGIVSMRSNVTGDADCMCGVGVPNDVCCSQACSLYGAFFGDCGTRACGILADDKTAPRYRSSISLFGNLIQP